MSTKSTIELTDDNEHIYYEHSNGVSKDGVWIGDYIVMEIDKRNINIIRNDQQGLVIEFINPDR